MSRGKPWSPTENQLNGLEVMSGHGLREEDLAAYCGVSLATFKRAEARTNTGLSERLLKGRSKANSAVAKTLFQMATSGKCPAATLFWCKVRLHWKEPPSGIEFPDDKGRPQPIPEGMKVIVNIPSNGRSAKE